MPRATRAVVSIALATALSMISGRTLAQTTAQPTNDLPNPYETVANHFKMPEGRTWGSTSAVDIDRDGRSIWVAERCGANSCLNSTLDIVLKFDPSGKLVRSFGGGLMIFPHGIHVDRQGNVWVTDGQDNMPRRRPGDPPDAPLPPAPARVIGHQVFKFSPEGTPLMTLGKTGGNQPGQPADPASFYQPNDVITLANGDILVAEGHSNAENTSHRIVRFNRDGKYLGQFGRRGSGPGEFIQPHALAMDSQGRLFVGDRSNNRIQILTTDGTFIAEWAQFSRPSGLFIDRNDMLYVADSESGSVNPPQAAWRRGIRVGSAKDGQVLYLMPDPETRNAPDFRGTSAAEGVAVDAQGNVYGAEVGPRALKKYVRTQRPTSSIAPLNDLPNPYQTIENHFKMPAGRSWGATSAVDIDRDGRSIWVAERCGANSCLDSKLDTVLKFDASGRLVKSFGGGLMIFPHGIHVDRDGNVWVTDAQGNKESTRGHQVFKFSPEGKILLRLGKPGVTGNGPDTLNEPCDVVTAPNGDIFVADGHAGQNRNAPPDTVARIVKYSKDGTFIKAWGRLGSAPGDFRTPHGIAFDSRGRLFVADRGNLRIQIFDQDGKFLDAWPQFSRVSGIFIDKNDVLYAADSESSDTSNPGWTRGIRIGSARDGKVMHFIPDTETKPTGTSNAEGVAADAQGNVYGAEVGPRALKKYVRRAGATPNP